MLKIISSEKHAAILRSNLTLAMDRETMAKRVNDVYARLAASECERMDMAHKIDALVEENAKLQRQLQIAVQDFQATQEVARWSDNLYNVSTKTV